MYTAFHHSLRYLGQDDNKALLAYLTGDSPLAPAAMPTAGDAARTVGAGRSHYLALCAGCHAANGQGKPNVSVALQGKSTLRNVDTHHLLEVLITGIHSQKFPGTPATQAKP